jgi:hypothetical protein
VVAVPLTSGVVVFAPELLAAGVASKALKR